MVFLLIRSSRTKLQTVFYYFLSFNQQKTVGGGGRQMHTLSKTDNYQSNTRSSSPADFAAPTTSNLIVLKQKGPWMYVVKQRKLTFTVCFASRQVLSTTELSHMPMAL